MSIAEKLTTVAENQQKVYDAGFAAGQAAGGEATQYGAFWDSYQDGGNRTDYDGAFGGVGWTNETFRPKHHIRPTMATYMFRKTGITGDLVELLDRCGVTLDFSNCTHFTEVFSNAPVTHVGVMDMRKATMVTNAFAYCSVKTIDKVILSANSAVTYFPGAAEQLESMTIEGTIAKTGFNAQYSTKLNKASITSIINALSTETSGFSITLSKVAVDREFFYAEANIPGSDTAEWYDLIEARPNWTINLV